MKFLNEQFNFDGAEEVASSIVNGQPISTKKVDTKKVDTKKVDTKKINKTDIKDATKQSNLANVIGKSVFFYETMASITSDRFKDQYSIMNTKTQAQQLRVMEKYMLTKYPEHSTINCDIITRIVNEKSLQTYVKKYLKQYNYFISRNGRTATRLNVLKAVGTGFRRIDNLFTGKLGNFLTKDNEYGTNPLQKFNRKILNNYKYSEDPKTTVPFKRRLTDSQLHKYVMSFYENEKLGKPWGEFK